MHAAAHCNHLVFVLTYEGFDLLADYREVCLIKIIADCSELIPTF